MKFERSCGTLLHPTSFPTPYGIGDLGKSAKHFIDFLESSHQSIWQVLPLGPTGYGDSPYASYSAFAGNHYLISPDILFDKGLVDAGSLQSGIKPSTTTVDYTGAYEFKDKLLKKASENFYSNADKDQLSAFNTFKKENKVWLDDYVLFMACFNHYGKRPWNTWDSDLAKRKKSALSAYRKKLSVDIDYHYWLQFEFANQWYDLKDYANSKHIRVVGDIPIFVDHNSSDVWANSKYFEVDKEGNRQLVAGVPPDYFSATGQLWGNPLYKWKVLEKDGFGWWIQRFEQMFSMFDAIRVDHFRGFDAYWEVKATEETAMNGRWVKGPGKKLFETIKEKLGTLPIIAEDLGVITPTVVELRDAFNFPGMKILQFSFSGGSTNSFQPHNYDTSNCVVYTGTHDNDTTRGWYDTAPEVEKDRARRYMRVSGEDISWDMITLGMQSVADQAIFPLQDFLSLDTDHRMNFPGTTDNNWQWRYTEDMLYSISKNRIRELIEMTNRNPRVEQSDSNVVELEAEEPN